MSARHIEEELTEVAMMSPTDSIFLTGETRETPMHVASLQTYDLPDGQDAPTVLREAFARLLTETDVAPLFRRRPVRSLTTLGQWGWAEDSEVDLEYHVRHSALPQPGRVRELLALVSRLHGSMLDRHHPLWEMHLIEGLEGNRFAVYTKIHHSLMDGVAGVRLLRRSLSEDPAGDSVPAFWVTTPRQEGNARRAFHPLGLPKAAASAAADLVGLTPRVLQLGQQVLRSQAAALPGVAPRTSLNVSVTGARRYAAQSYSMDRMRAVAKATDVTLNDVLLAMSSGALRTYLLTQESLPDAPLIAMTPVSLRQGSDPEAAGNAVGAILANLATDLADPADRLEAISESTRRAKALLAGLSQLQATAVSAAFMVPMLLSTITKAYKVGTLPFNVVISNVPGPRSALYMRGARLSGLYPLSIPVNGQALNITATSYAEHMGIGITACRRSAPHVQRMLGHLETSLEELEQVAGI